MNNGIPEPIVYVLEQKNPGPWGPVEPVGIYSTLPTALAKADGFVPRDATWTFNTDRRTYETEAARVRLITLDA